MAPGLIRASSLDLLVVGLGDPGREYARNRHNIGGLVADELARRHDGRLEGEVLGSARGSAHRRTSRRAPEKPETFMDESGRSVKAAAAFFEIDPDAILIVHDEGDLDTRAGSRCVPSAGWPGHTDCARSRPM